MSQEESPNTEERLFHAMHNGLTSYIQHRIPDDEDRADDVYQEVIDLVIAKTE